MLLPRVHKAAYNAPHDHAVVTVALCIFGTPVSIKSHTVSPRHWGTPMTASPTRAAIRVQAWRPTKDKDPPVKSGSVFVTFQRAFKEHTQQ